MGTLHDNETLQALRNLEDTNIVLVIIFLYFIFYLWCQNIKSIYSLYEPLEKKWSIIYTLSHHLALFVHRLDIHIVLKISWKYY